MNMTFISLIGQIEPFLELYVTSFPLTEISRLWALIVTVILNSLLTRFVRTLNIRLFDISVNAVNNIF